MAEAKRIKSEQVKFMNCFNTEELSKTHPGDEDIMISLKAK
jgi:hypothetical protein